MWTLSINAYFVWCYHKKINKRDCLCHLCNFNINSEIYSFFSHSLSHSIFLYCPKMQLSSIMLFMTLTLCFFITCVTGVSPFLSHRKSILLQNDLNRLKEENAKFKVAQTNWRRNIALSAKKIRALEMDVSKLTETNTRWALRVNEMKKELNQMKRQHLMMNRFFT